MSTPDEIRTRLEEMEPAQRNQMTQVLNLLAAPPESILALLDRAEIRWKREYFGKESDYPLGALVIDWRELMLGEQRIQEQGPPLKRLLTNEFGNQATKNIEVDKTSGEVKQAPTMHEIKDES